ncbi:hypothetical protein AB0L06_40005 [Spirillospora sp. NPDC052269]
MTTYRRPLLSVIATGFGAAALIALGSGPALASDGPMGHHGHHMHMFMHHMHMHHHGMGHHGMGHWGCPPGPIKDGGHCRPHYPPLPSTR